VSWITAAGSHTIIEGGVQVVTALNSLGWSHVLKGVGGNFWIFEPTIEEVIPSLSWNSVEFVQANVYLNGWILWIHWNVILESVVTERFACTLAMHAERMIYCDCSMHWVKDHCDPKQLCPRIKATLQLFKVIKNVTSIWNVYYCSSFRCIEVASGLLLMVRGK